MYVDLGYVWDSVYTVLQVYGKIKNFKIIEKKQRNKGGRLVDISVYAHD